MTTKNKLYPLMVVLTIVSLASCQRQNTAIEGIEQGQSQSQAEDEKTEVEQSRVETKEQNLGQNQNQYDDSAGEAVEQDLLSEGLPQPEAAQHQQIQPQQPNCLDVLVERFGSDRIYYPAMHLFPEIYEQAQQAGADGDRVLRAKLKDKACGNIPQRVF